MGILAWNCLKAEKFWWRSQVWKTYAEINASSRERLLWSHIWSWVLHREWWKMPKSKKFGLIGQNLRRTIDESSFKKSKLQRMNLKWEIACFWRSCNESINNKYEAFCQVMWWWLKNKPKTVATSVNYRCNKKLNLWDLCLINISRWGLIGRYTVILCTNTSFFKETFWRTYCLLYLSHLYYGCIVLYRHLLLQADLVK